jgi:diaminopimelate epimerase
MSVRFTKMQALGNDYVYVNGFEESLPENFEKLAREISDRHFGVGGDGLVMILPSDKADARMRMFNADGSESEMCGNAIRCVAKYLHDHGICPRETLEIETGAGVLTLELEIENGRCGRVRVDMGRPILRPADIPTTLRDPGGSEEKPVVEVPQVINQRSFLLTCVSVGNPHCVVFVDALEDELVHQVGPRLEIDGHFPNRVNVEFVEVLSEQELRMRVWERGSGETLACGTGACAVCVAGVLAGKSSREVLVHLPGGDLNIEWSEADDHLFMTGPAVEVFSGRWKETG